MKDDRPAVFGICILLALAVWLAFGQSVHYGFVNYDDDIYIYQNAVVQQGLTLKGVGWALTYGKIGHWHPLTWVTHMLDCQFYGLNAGGHHLTNILFHTAAVILLFLVLRQMTACLWRSAFVAAVFAVHPLRVESVVWIAERKDVLSAFFFMLTLGAYVRYTRKPSSRARHTAVMVVFALGLLSKNMVVTLPFVLLLLDWWPLGRLKLPDARDKPEDREEQRRILRRLIVEKIPLLILSIASCVATFLVPEKVAAAEKLPFLFRIENALVSYVTYLRQTVWPVNLANPYPNPVHGLPFWETGMALALLAVISAGAFVMRSKHPWFAVGWLWYFGMLVPVIGVVQISYYSHADRYTYLPQIGLLLIMAWGASELSVSWRHRRLILGVGSAFIIATLITCTRAQTACWRDSESLWTHTLAVNPDCAVAHNDLGLVFLQRGQVDSAAGHFEQAVLLQPGDESSQKNLGSAFLQKGQVDDAIAQFQKALELKPDDAGAHSDLGLAFYRKGQTDAAIAEYQKALKIQPDDAGVHHNFGLALFKEGLVDEAMTHYRKTLEIQPDDAEVENDLGTAFNKKGQVAEAIQHWQRSLELRPQYLPAQSNLAWALATNPDASLRNGAKAVQLARQANQSMRGKSLLILQTLAAAYAEDGQFTNALATAGQALQLAVTEHNVPMINSFQAQIKLYESGRPFHTAAN